MPRRRPVRSPVDPAGSVARPPGDAGWTGAGCAVPDAYVGDVLGLPDSVTACLFDLDGVLTPTATVHNAAWKQTFDDFLRSRDGDGFTPFDPDADYRTHVDGKPRADGVRDFLASRDIHLPEGDPGDPPDQPAGEVTVAGLGNRKNAVFAEKLDSDGVQAYPGSRRYLEAARDAGLRRAVVSSSANCRKVVEAAGLTDLLEVRVDGITSRERHLTGKPAPDIFLAAARELGVAADAAAVFEDAQAGVAAGRAGAFGWVVGVDRVGGDNGQSLLDSGADTVVGDLDRLLDGKPASRGMR